MCRIALGVLGSQFEQVGVSSAASACQYDALRYAQRMDDHCWHFTLVSVTRQGKAVLRNLLKVVCTGGKIVIWLTVPLQGIDVLC